MDFETGYMPEEANINPKPETKTGGGLEHTEDGKNEFHGRVAERVNSWLERVGVYDRKQLYRPEKASDGWDKVDPEDYFLHRITVIGLPLGSKSVTAEQVGKILQQYREAISSQSEKVATARSAYAEFNQDSSLQVGEFDPERLFLLPRSRIVELAGDELDGLAYTLKGTVGEIIVPIDDETLSDPEHPYDVVVHELGHQARQAQGLDEDASRGLEEGIIQANAKKIEQANDKLSRRSGEVYHIETEVAERLGVKLGVDLFTLSHSQIREKMENVYANLGMVGEPYDELIYDIYDYRKMFDGFANQLETDESIGESDIADMKQQLKAKKRSIYDLWGFSSE